MPDDVKNAALKTGFVLGGGTATALTIQDWVAVATLAFILLQIGLLLPKYWNGIRSWFGGNK